MRRVALVCSHGGHLSELLALEPAVAHLERVWVTAPGPQVERLRARGERVLEVVNPQRRPDLLARNLGQAVRALRTARPSVVVTSGANVAVPYALMARAAGVPLVVVESIARTDGLSLTARILRPAASRMLVQWPALEERVPGSTLVRPALLEDLPAGPVAEGRGTFVTVGTHTQPFDRLLELVDRAAAAGDLPAPVVVEAPRGRYRPQAVPEGRALSSEEHRRRLEECAVLVCHGGAGLLTTALRARRRPLVLPRRRAEEEHVDDHQVAMTARFVELGLAVSLERTRVADAVRRAAEPLVAPPLPGVPAVALLRGIVDAA